MDRRITEFFAANAETLANDIASLVAVDSSKGQESYGAPYGRGPKSALEVAAGMAECYGLSAQVRGDRVCVIELGDGEPELGILAHLDVVPPAGVWTKTTPFKLLQEDGILYGRGVADDKGPAVAALYALRAVRELGIPLRRKVQLILGSDEENGSSDIAWYLQHYTFPPKVFTPDACFPLVNGEKGKLDMTVTSGPSNGEGVQVVSLKGGSVPNAVPASCEARLRNVTAEAVEHAFKGAGVKAKVEAIEGAVRVECEGKASHASKPEGGDNAICAMLRGLAALRLDNSPGTDAILALERSIPYGDTSGVAIGAACSDEETGELTVNLGVISYDETTGLQAKIDCRVPACGDGNIIAGKLRVSLRKAAALKITGLIPPHSTPADSELVRGLLKIYREATGQNGEAFAIGGLTYVHDIEGGVAFGCCFPDTEYHEHEPDECMPTAQLLLAGQMFAQAIADFCGE